jgi:hypothetical protein
MDHAPIHDCPSVRLDNFTSGSGLGPIGGAWCGFGAGSALFFAMM